MLLNEITSQRLGASCVLISRKFIKTTLAVAIIGSFLIYSQHNEERYERFYDYVMDEWERKEVEDRLNRLQVLLEHSNRYSVERDTSESHTNGVPAGSVRVKCNWESDLSTHNRSCESFLFAEAGISLDRVSAHKNKDWIDVKLQSSPSTFDLFLSQLQSVIPLEWTLPIQLYDHRGPRPLDHGMQKIVSTFRQPPRYVVGTLQFPMGHGVNATNITVPMLEATLDLGNSQGTILMIESCLGCSSKELPETGCPRTVPTCETGNFTQTSNSSMTSFCWVSHPNQFVPNYAFEYTGKVCSAGESTEVTLFNRTVCRQCFGGGSHSRFITNANLKEFSLLDATVRPLLDISSGNTVNYLQRSSQVISNFDFSALVRTVPQIDRIWSNIGIGAGSSFLTQLSATSLMIDFDYYGTSDSNKIVFSPSPILYKGWKEVPYRIQLHKTKQKRIHKVDSFYFENDSNSTHDIAPTTSLMPSLSTKNMLFHIDTGNNGISIADEDLQKLIKIATRGVWHHGRLFTPYSHDTAPHLKIALSSHFDDVENSGVTVNITIPGSVWVNSPPSPEMLEEIQTTISRDTFFLDKDVQEYMQLFTPPLSLQLPPGYPTIFNKYHKNVFGLPFLSAPGYSYVFDDEKKVMYIKQVD